MPKKARRKLKKKYHESGIPRISMPEASLTEPTARLARGKSAIVSPGELRAARSQRKRPKEWRQVSTIIEKGPFRFWDDFAIALGYGALQDVTQESVDEMAGLLTAMVPGEKDIGRRRVGQFEVRKSQQAIQEVMNRYKDEFPGPDLAGRALSVIVQIKTLGGQSMTGFLAHALPRYGLKATVQMAKALDFLHNKYPKLARIAKINPEKYFKTIIPKAKKMSEAGDWRYDTAGTFADAALSETMGQRQKTGLEALEEGLTGKGTLISAGIAGSQPLVKGAVKYTSRGINKAIDLANEWVPSLETKIARAKLKSIGYSDEAIDYLQENKYWMPSKLDTAPDLTLNNFKHFVETVLNRKEALDILALSKLNRNIGNINKEDVIEKVNDAILGLFKNKKYEEAYINSPIGSKHGFSLSAVDEEILERKLTPFGDPETITIGEMLPTEILEKKSLQGKSPKIVYKDLFTKRDPAKGELLKAKQPQEGFSFMPDDDAPGEFTFISKEKSRKGATGSGDEPSERMRIISPSEQVIRGKTPKTRSRLGYQDKEAIEDLEFIRDWAEGAPGKEKILKELLGLRERMLNLKTGNLTSTKLKEILYDLSSKAKFDQEIGMTIFQDRQLLDVYRAVHGSLYHEVNKILKKQNPRYAERIESVAKTNDALSGGARFDPENNFITKFGITAKATYDPKTNKKFIAVELKEPEVTLQAIEEGLVIGAKPHSDDYTKLLKDFVTSGLETVRKNRKFQKLDKKTDIPMEEGYTGKILKESQEGLHPSEKLGQRQMGEKTQLRRLDDWTDEEAAQELYDDFKKDIVFNKFNDPGTANEMINQRLRTAYGQVINPKTKKPVIKAHDKEKEIGLRRRVLYTFFQKRSAIPGVMAALYLVNKIAKKKIKKEALDTTPQEMLKNAEDWFINFKTNPDKALRGLDWSYDDLRHINARAQRNVDEIKKNIGQEDGDVKFTPIRPLDKRFTPERKGPPSSPANESIEKLDAKHRGAMIEPPISPSPASEDLPLVAEEDFASADSIGLNSFENENFEDFEDFENFKDSEISDPEVEDRKRRKEKINAFLKQQGAYKRKPRRSFA
tara:strand:+ start:2479 stop:5715 length:3237 start_codon:yes stop_codon:yes gene_type:complete